MGIFAPLIWHPLRILDLENKKRYLTMRLQTIKIKAAESENAIYQRTRPRLVVRRKTLFADAFHQMKKWSKSQLMSRMSVSFLNEEGVDAGGLTREWYEHMGKAMFNPNYGMFIPSADNNAVFQPNPNSNIHMDHLSNFKFVGLFVAKAIHDGHLLNAYFTKSFLKHILAIETSFEDYQAIDYNHYKNLKWMVENNIENVIFERFSVPTSRFGVKGLVDLKEGGEDIEVNNSNKKQFVDLIAKYKMTDSVKVQLDAFKEGFNILIPNWLISIFTFSELDLLICGMPEIDVNDLRNNCNYHGGLSPITPLVKWFWEVLLEMDKEELAALLQFVTGTSKVPLGGFKNLQGMNGIQKFQLHPSVRSDERLPTAHTCFNQLDLPRYSNKQILKEKLLMAVRECSQGFAFS